MNNQASDLDDQALLALYYKEQDKALLGVLFSRFTMRLIGVAFKYVKDIDEAKDLVQHVYLKALIEIDKQKIQNVGGWLYRIVCNEAINATRSRKYNESDEFLDTVHQDDKVSDADYWKVVATEDQLRASILLLKEEQRICIEMFYLQKKSYQQIVEETAWTMKEVKSFLQNGKRNLRLMLERNNNL